MHAPARFAHVSASPERARTPGGFTVGSNNAPAAEFRLTDLSQVQRSRSAAQSQT